MHADICSVLTVIMMSQKRFTKLRHLWNFPVEEERDLKVQKTTGNLVKRNWVQTLIYDLERTLFYVFKEMAF